VIRQYSHTVSLISKIFFTGPKGRGGEKFHLFLTRTNILCASWSIIPPTCPFVQTMNQEELPW
jgi:hypothetical protein